MRRSGTIVTRTLNVIPDDRKKIWSWAPFSQTFFR